ncbi:MAG: UDP-N-acetylmuramoylalanyl-D-glutamate--2,6-diaminopimelate ligase [Candidatus Parcubacteria bacterium]|jgi:UDP-N-acetylmuramoyl-L-alanyl-D-glutamate--2,6-diaminopimelate ligase
MFQKSKNIYHLLAAIVANFYYGFPSKRLNVIGITGTDGKTTTTSLVYHILKSAGKKVSMISTVYAKVGDKVYDTGLHTTTPDPFVIQKLLKQSADAGDEYFILEATSHALDQNRVFGIRFAHGLVTNITHEHLDYHKDYDRYVRAKALLLLNADRVYVNHDDESYPLLSCLLQNDGIAYKTYGLTQESDFNTDISQSIATYLSEFNKYNYLAAYAITMSAGLPDEQIFAALKSFKLPKGRLEVIYNNSFKAIVDFAHTPNSIAQVLKSLKTEPGFAGRLIHVFGAAGLRDHSKRKLMGESSATYADIIILTEEDYRTENPQQIAEQIAKGIQEKGFSLYDRDDDNMTSKGYVIITDRQEAIDYAISLANEGDTVVVTGKGHEQSLCRGKVEHPWDDSAAILTSVQHITSAST